ncbi:putative quinol monooxygenase [Rhodococcus jostii]|uniref:Antibiotic biosynthesis monooxygenase n=1 Tax=Rhodococcus jostii TaxID=132919 RepID=A0ABU4CLI0_RHOJO|nr:antibiotic biosynthesis monooxygenase [Rhodococcus jostii]MDV6284065.1 antibiotic biosynthesis monooxygenase [Rhodococcus jostii]
MSVLTILTLHVPRERSGDVVHYYARARILEESGAVSAQLCVTSDDPGTVVVVARWPDTSAYEAWQAAPARSEFSQGILDAAGDSVTATSEVFQVAIDT